MSRSAKTAPTAEFPGSDRGTVAPARLVHSGPVEGGAARPVTLGIGGAEQASSGRGAEKHETATTSPAADALGPDFLCVGLQKAGTQWLYDQLQNHDDFWMPPQKELHFFDREFPDVKLRRTARKFSKDPARVSDKQVRRGDAPVDARGADFFHQVRTYRAEQNDLEAYAKLFRAKGDKLSGDITPNYCSLDPRIVRSLATRFPSLKICLLLREPVARLWSQWQMAKTVTEAPNFKSFIEIRDVLRRSYPSEIARLWSQYFGDRFRYFFLEDIAARPEETRAEILSFLGGDPAKPSNVQASFNRKATSAPLTRSKKAERLMRELFEEERAECARVFGGPALQWPDHPY